MESWCVGLKDREQKKMEAETKRTKRNKYVRSII